MIYESHEARVRFKSPGPLKAHLDRQKDGSQEGEFLGKDNFINILLI
jgi:hypothetical protein